MCRLLRLVLRFPDLAFVFAGDSGFGTHEVARFCHRHPDLNLFGPPRPRSTPVTAAQG